MQKMYFCAGNTFSTGDAIASALIHYARALAQTIEYDVVDLPVVRNDGTSGTTTLMLTPASQMSSESLPPTRAEILDVALVQRLEERTAFLLQPHPPMTDTVHHASLMEYFDY